MNYLTILIILLSSNPFGESQTEWELKKDEDGIKVWIAESKNSSFKTYKCQTVIDAPLEEVFAYLIKEENIPVYYNMVSKVREINEISENQSNYILEFDFPWPLKNRVAKVESKYYPVEVGAYDIETTAVEFTGSKNDCVVVSKMWCSFSLVNAGEGKTYLRHYGFMEPNGAVPARFANLKVVDAPFATLKNLKRILKSQW